MSLHRTERSLCWRYTVRGRPVRVTLDAALSDELAGAVERFLVDLACAAEYAITPTPAALAWANSVSPIVRQRLRAAGLVPAPKSPGAPRREPDPRRQVYVSVADAEAVLARLSGQMALAFVLARWCGLRVPSEIEPLTFGCFDRRVGTLAVFAPKTGRKRLVPVPRKVWDALPDPPGHHGEDRVFQPFLADPRKIIAACRSAGVSPWPKPWQNLRASYATDVANACGAADATRILGHGRYVAAQHYWMADAERIGRLGASIWRS